ncbi:MAG: glutamate 5-kinase [Rhodobacteraceae bacterium]|nr:glutamate 5-kinase [Paracoccaceae bacterium]
MDAIEYISKSRRIVVKIGSALLVDQESGTVRGDWLQGLASDIGYLRQQNSDPLIVSSGSIALGRSVLKLTPGQLSLEQSQAAAAVGQIRLAGAYDDALAPLGLVSAQILLTLDDSRNRRRYLNSRATLLNLLAQGVIPVVNENDTVATDEIRFGDNDRLAAQVAAMTNADCLVLLSDIDGLYDRDPKRHPEARHIPVIRQVEPEIEAMAQDAGSEFAKGGMRTKIQAARTASSAGCATLIADGKRRRPITALLGGASNTVFLPQGDPQSARKHWIGSMKPQGRIRVDHGALKALGNGRSLLPAGVAAIEGDFGRGEPVEIAGPDAIVVAIGLVRYTGAEARLICGKKSSEVAEILGYPARTALVHRDDMARLKFATES